MAFNPDLPDPTMSNVRITIDPFWLALPLVPGGSSHTRGDIWKSQWGISGNQVPTDVVTLYCDIATRGLQEQQQPNYAGEAIIGRAEPFLTWMSNGEESFALNLSYAQQTQSDASASWSPGSDPHFTNVMFMGRWLQALTKPLYDNIPGDDQTVEPPVLIVTIGLLKVARCVARSCSLTWGEAFDPGTMVPKCVNAAMAFSVQRIQSGTPYYSSFYTVNGIDVPVWNRFIEWP